MVKFESNYELSLTQIAELEENVARGVALLDSVLPNWYRDVDLGKLDMADCTECIVGQAVHKWSEIKVSDASIFYMWDDKHGFNVPAYNNVGDRYEQAECHFAAYKWLEDIWTRVVKEKWAEDKV